MDIVAASGSGFAFPSQTTYVARDDRLDGKRVRTAEEQMRAWRERGELPLPMESKRLEGLARMTPDSTDDFG